MTVRYLRGRTPACYDTENPPAFTMGFTEQPKGPFASCSDCPYPSHGFLCHGKDGDCLRTDMNKINQRRKENAPC